MVSNSREKLWKKACCLHKTENKFPLAVMKDLLKNMSLLDEKVASGGSNFWKNGRE